MTLASVPWLELAVAIPLLGALALAVARVRDPLASYRWCLGFAGAGLACALAAALTFGAAGAGSADVLPRVLGRRAFALDRGTALRHHGCSGTHGDGDHHHATQQRLVDHFLFPRARRRRDLRAQLARSPLNAI